ncbi:MULTISPECIES: sporulation protein YunB [Sporosarcina]|uniref:Sporulation protein YunB n=1 Tax=Sporosarcina contaminans TaxID=633403 RepID=A0ABW3TZJ8_9BACL
MKFHGQVPRKYYRGRRKPKRKWFPILIPAFLITIALFFYYVNSKLTPIYLLYAEVQTERIAAHVISQANKSRSTELYNANEIIEIVPNDSPGMVVNTINTDIINKSMSELQSLVEAHLASAESGNLEMLPISENIEYDPKAMESQGGIVYFVPMGQALNLPILGNLGPKIPIRFHVIGEVQTEVVTDIEEFGINNALVKVDVVVKVNVQIIVPLATRKSVVEKRIPMAIGLIQSPIPQIYNRGDVSPPQVEVPFPLTGTQGSP